MEKLELPADTGPQKNESGSLCPAVKAADMIGDKWTLLILRELFLGSSRYNQFQNAMPRISPSVLSGRLKQMENHGLIIKKNSQYLLTKCGRELAPVTDYLARWGLRWARRQLKEEDLDVGCFMWDFHRTIKTSELPDGETVMSIQFPELETSSRWWIIANGSVVDLCSEDPGKEIDLYISGSLPVMASIWMGDTDIKQARNDNDLNLTGESYLVRSATSWFPMSLYSEVRPKRFIP